MEGGREGGMEGGRERGGGGRKRGGGELEVERACLAFLPEG